MNDLIYRQEAMNSLTREYNRRYTGDGLKLAWIEKAVNEAPTVDAVEVVRCKACAHWSDENSITVGYCDVWDQYINNGEFFCSCGCRRLNNSK